MRKSLLAILIVTGVGLLLAAQAGAAVVSSDFEASSGYVSGPFPTGPVGGYYPPESNSLVGQPAGNPPLWQAGGYGSDPSETPDPWGQPAYVIQQPSTSNNVAAFTGSSSGGIHPSEMQLPVTVGAAGTTTLSAQLYFPSAVNANMFPVLNLAFMQVGVNFGDSHYYNGQFDGTLAFNTNGTDKVVSMDAWHTLLVTINPGTDPTNASVAVSVDGSQVSAWTQNLSNGSLPFNQTKLDGWMDETTGNGLGDQILVDNVVITNVVPEPATMALLALGGLLVARRRRN